MTRSLLERARELVGGGATIERRRCTVRAYPKGWHPPLAPPACSGDMMGAGQGRSGASRPWSISEPAAPATPPSLEFSGDTWYATGKLGRDLHTGASTIEYESRGPNWRAARLWATARGHVTEVDS